MSAPDDGRLERAKSIPILDVAARLGIQGLRRQGVEHVGACPVCGDGGKHLADRFAINPARGVFVCRQCPDGGDGVQLVRLVQGCDFRAALDWLVGAADWAPDPAQLARQKEAAAKSEAARAEFEAQARARAIRQAREVWHATAPGQGSLAEVYLAARGVVFDRWPPALRFLPDHPYIKSDQGTARTWHRGPCLVAGVQSPDGRVSAVHQTWIDPARPGHKATILARDGSAAPAKLVRGSKKGGAIRLTPRDPAGRLVMGEGIETTGSALAAGVWPGATFWAGVDLGNMSGRMLRVEGTRWSGRPDMADDRAFLPPEGTTQLMFLMDGDSSEAATWARLAAGLRRAQAHNPGLRARIMRAAPGADFNDMKEKPVCAGEVLTDE